MPRLGAAGRREFAIIVLCRRRRLRKKTRDSHNFFVRVGRGRLDGLAGWCKMQWSPPAVRCMIGVAGRRPMGRCWGNTLCAGERPRLPWIRGGARDGCSSEWSSWASSSPSCTWPIPSSIGIPWSLKTSAEAATWRKSSRCSVTRSRRPTSSLSPPRRRPQDGSRVVPRRRGHLRRHAVVPRPGSLGLRSRRQGRHPLPHRPRHLRPDHRPARRGRATQPHQPPRQGQGPQTTRAALALVNGPAPGSVEIRRTTVAQVAEDLASYRIAWDGRGSRFGSQPGDDFQELLR